MVVFKRERVKKGLMEAQAWRKTQRQEVGTEMGSKEERKETVRRSRRVSSISLNAKSHGGDRGYQLIVRPPLPHWTHCTAPASESPLRATDRGATKKRCPAPLGLFLLCAARAAVTVPLPSLHLQALVAWLFPSSGFFTALVAEICGSLSLVQTGLGAALHRYLITD